MQFRANSDALGVSGTGVSMPGGVAPGGLIQDATLAPQPYRPEMGRADKHASNIVHNFGGGYSSVLDGSNF